DVWEEGGELHGGLGGGEWAVGRVGPEVVNCQEVTPTARALVGGPQTINPLAGSRVALPVARLQVQRAKFVDAQAPPAVGPLPVQSANGPVFLPEQRICRFFPGLGAMQSDLAAVQKLPQPLDADVGHNVLFDQVFAQLGQRPLRHADERLGRRQRHFADLLAQIRRKLPRRVADLPVRVPGNAVDAVVVETVDDDPSPLRRTVDALADVTAPQAAARQQNDAGMQAIDGVAMLAFHAQQLLLFMRAQGAYDNLVHGSLRVGRTERSPMWRLLFSSLPRSCATFEHYCSCATRNLSAGNGTSVFIRLWLKSSVALARSRRSFSW